MTPLAFQPFENVLFPCFLLGKDGNLYRNDAALNSGPPLSDEAAMTSLLRASAQQMSTGDTAISNRPLLSDALRKRSLTLMDTEDGLLAVAAQETNSPVSAFSSQMRERLTNIFATLPLLNNYIEDQHLHFAEEIQANCYQLLRLASNLEDTGIVENRRYNLQPVDLTSLVSSLCDGVNAVALKRQVDLECIVPKHPIVVQADSRLVSSALLNILRNSIAYTRDGNRITVKLSTSGKNALLTVEDKGLGILPKNITRIFDPYFSSDPYGDDNMRPGVGLGLSVAREAITAMGGTVSAESRFGEGTRIIMFMPLDNSGEDALYSAPAGYLLNRYSPIYIQLCGHCFLPGL